MARAKKGATLQAMLATPIEVELGGKTYRLARLTFAQLAEFEEWARQQPFRELEGKLNALPEGTLRDEMKPLLLQEAMAASRDSSALGIMAASISGVVKMFTLALRKHHPELDAGTIEAIVAAEGIHKIEELVDKATPTEGMEGKAKAGK